MLAMNQAREHLLSSRSFRTTARETLVRHYEHGAPVAKLCLMKTTMDSLESMNLVKRVGGITPGVPQKYDLTEWGKHVAVSIQGRDPWIF